MVNDVDLAAFKNGLWSLHNVKSSGAPNTKAEVKRA